MQIFPNTFNAKPDQREFQIDVSAKRGAQTAVVSLVGAHITEAGSESVNVSTQWSIRREGPSNSWILTTKELIKKPVEVVVYATGTCGQLCPTLYITPEVEGAPVEVEDDDTTPSNPVDGDLEPVDEDLTPAQISLLQASRFVGIHAGTTIQEDFDVLVERELIELTDGEWRAK